MIKSKMKNICKHLNQTTEIEETNKKKIVVYSHGSNTFENILFSNLFSNNHFHV